VEVLTLALADRRALLLIAREAIRSRLGAGSAPASAANPRLSRFGEAGSEAPGPDDPLARACPAFVTLRRGAELRGCIGHLECDRPLADVVARAAIAAALEDPRFPPVTAAELEVLSIEISVLGPMQPVTDPSTIEVGRHGLVVHAGSRRGLLLPQVASEWGWDRETFLEQLCLKAGLSRGAWRTAQLFTFEAEVFGDSSV
jgi:AmmeMemoRadiSam system protein A